MATLAAPDLGACADDALARLAIAGDGHAFAELYDRHERRVYGFCLRMLGSPHDAADATQETFVRLLQRLPALEGRELNFAAYVLTVARNACYDMIEGRRRVEPVAEHAEPRRPEPGNLEVDPERAALLAATREQLQAANASLPGRQREVLALRELESLSYEQIGEIMELNANAVAQLISRARLKLHEVLRGRALASVNVSSPDCERALPLLAAREDRQGDPDELGWLRSHLARCEPCRVRRAAMEEAGVSYRSLAPIVPVIWLRRATIARAAELVGADWSKISRAPRRTGAPDAGGGQQAQDGDLAQPGGSGPQPDELSSALASTKARNGSDRRERHIWLGLTGLGLCLLVTLLLASSLGHEPASPALNVSRVAGNAVGAPSYGDNTRARDSSQPRRSRAGARGGRSGGGSGGGRAASYGTPAALPPGSPPSATSKSGGSGSNRPSQSSTFGGFTQNSAQGGLHSSSGSGSHRSPGPRSRNSPSRNSGSPTTPGPGSTSAGGSGGGSTSTGAEHPTTSGAGNPAGSGSGGSPESSSPPGPGPSSGPGPSPESGPSSGPSPSHGPSPSPGPAPTPGPGPSPIPGRPPGA